MVKALLSSAGGTGSILGQGAIIPHALQPKCQNIKQRQYCNKFNEDFKNGPHQKNLLKNKIKLPSFSSSLIAKCQTPVTT